MGILLYRESYPYFLDPNYMSTTLITLTKYIQPYMCVPVPWDELRGRSPLILTRVTPHTRTGTTTWRPTRTCPRSSRTRSRPRTSAAPPTTYVMMKKSEADWQKTCPPDRTQSDTHRSTWRSWPCSTGCWPWRCSSPSCAATPGGTAPAAAGPACTSRECQRMIVVTACLAVTCLASLSG